MQLKVPHCGHCTEQNASLRCRSAIRRSPHLLLLLLFLLLRLSDSIPDLNKQVAPACPWSSARLIEEPRMGEVGCRA